MKHQGGFPCPSCGGPGRVADTRVRQDRQGLVYRWRRRECLRCYERFSTREVVTVPKEER